MLPQVFLPSDHTDQGTGTARFLTWEKRVVATWPPDWILEVPPTVLSQTRASCITPAVIRNCPKHVTKGSFLFTSHMWHFCEAWVSSSAYTSSMPSLWITVLAYHEDCHCSGKRVPILLTSATSVFVELPLESPGPVIDPLLQGGRASQLWNTTCIISSSPNNVLSLNHQMILP